MHTVTNNGSLVQYETKNENSELNIGWNVFRISETKKADSTIGSYGIDTTHTYYAVVKYTRIAENKYVAGNIKYFNTFNSTTFDVSASSYSGFATGEVQTAEFINEKKGNKTT